MSCPYHHRSQTARSLRLFVGCSLVVGLLWPGEVKAAITYSGEVNISVTADFNGVYLDIASGTPTNPNGNTDAVLSDSYTVGYSQPANWDINIFFSGIGIAYSDTFSPFLDGTSADPNAINGGSQILNVAVGIDIQSAAATRALALTSFGGSGRPEGGSGESHFDTPDLNGIFYSAFTPGSEGHIAFVIDTTEGDQHGWMRVTLKDDGSLGVIHDWAYSDEVGFQVGQIPEPSSFILLLLGSLALCRRKRA